MVDGMEAGSGRRVRRFRTVSEKRRIAELTFEPGAGVALVARAHGVSANQGVQVAPCTEARRTERAGGTTESATSGRGCSSL
jgi:transposase-like protein